ncbi:MAG TPA: class I SAM-dependent methyltransferase [Candidatus Sulfotelmatobacter sp.]
MQTELVGILIAELERHFNEQLLPELQKKVEAIIERDLPGRVEAIIERELPGRMATMLGPVLPGQELSNANKILVDRFTQVFEENLWGDSETVSGWGSRKDSPSVAAAISALEIAKTTANFMSINDIPCGDFNWIEKFLRNVPEICYRGFDIVSALIHKNKMLYPNYEFELLDVTSTLPPRADLILSKDFFNHLTYADVKKALANMKKSHSGYLLASNNFDVVNEELPANAGSSSRHLDLCAEPFNLPVPIWRTHYMGLWKFSDIKVDQ